MTMNKKKIAVVALLLCVCALVSMGSLAWFTDSDQVTNTLKFATDKDGNVDFSVDVYEFEDGVKTDAGRTYEKLLPGQLVEKTPVIANDGQYNEWIRVKVTLSDTDVWVALLGTSDPAKASGLIFKGFNDKDWEFDSKNFDVKDGAKTVTFYAYSKAPFAPGQTSALFTGVQIPTTLTNDTAKAMSGAFTIDVHADAIQSDEITAKTAVDAFALFDAQESN